MIYFTSDLHLGHENAIKFTDRPFHSAEEMNETLIENYNSLVSADDTVYILGDLSFRIPTEQAEQLIARLNGTKVFLQGNHDKEYNPSLFSETGVYKEIFYQKHCLCLMHYPMLEWRNSRHGSIHLHGHIHSVAGKAYDISGFSGTSYNQDNRDRGIMRYDVGVDANNYFPVSIEKIFDFFGIAHGEQFEGGRQHG